MPLFSEYRQALSEGFATCHDANLPKKIGLAALIILSVRQEKVDERNFLVTPRVDSPEVAWQPWTEEELNQGLKELTDESGSSSYPS